MNGLIYRIDNKFYLSLIDKSGKVHSGFNIYAGIHDDLLDTQIILAEIEIMDGTEPVEINNDIDYFLKNELDKNKLNYFYKIVELLRVTLKQTVLKFKEENTLEDIMKNILQLNNKQ